MESLDGLGVVDGLDYRFGAAFAEPGVVFGSHEMRYRSCWTTGIVPVVIEVTAGYGDEVYNEVLRLLEYVGETLGLCIG